MHMQQEKPITPNRHFIRYDRSQQVRRRPFLMPGTDNIASLFVSKISILQRSSLLGFETHLEITSNWYTNCHLNPIVKLTVAAANTVAFILQLTMKKICFLYKLVLSKRLKGYVHVYIKLFNRLWPMISHRQVKKEGLGVYMKASYLD